MGINAKQLKKNWTQIKETPVENLLERRELMSGHRIERSSSSKGIKARTVHQSVFVTQKGNVVGGGTNSVLNALAAYLRYLEGTARDDWQEYVVTSSFYNIYVKPKQPDFVF